MQLKLTIFIFWTKLAQKGCFQSKTDAKNTAIEFWIFELIWVAIFFPEQANLNFWTKYIQKRYLGPKPKKVNVPIEFCILQLV